MNRTVAKLAVGSAFALFASTALAGVASAQETDPVTFSAADNKDCTATFTVVNTTNSGMNEVVYWTGEDAPQEAPPFGEDGGSEQALLADAAFVGENGQWYAPWFDGDHPEGYQRNLDPVTTTKVVDFSDVDSVEGSVTVKYRMTGLEADDYDTALQTETVTGCDTGTGSLGSIDVLGSAGGDGSLGSLFGNKE